ncbi:RND transporter [Salinadaptatus halalkaliphilus]|uniref:RND transporter n=1 Tax=Salinadaptatus halalkaliphilus TaxID=2419781 RepID=A0A4S3TLN4_9EURY|nr:MMPL family transporter [Salinadaptatus halalkaliphilus]THE63905.1 RND transporter [Salinadaptatus halalkaliphilus]
MAGDLAARYARGLVARRKLVVVAVLLLTALVGAGAVLTETEDAGIGEFETGSEEEAAQEYVDTNYATGDDILTQIVVRDEGGDVLTRESLLEGLYLQRDAQNTPSMNATLSEDGATADGGFVGLENLVAIVAVFEDRVAAADGPPETDEPTLEEQIDALESRSEEEVEQLLADVLDPDGETPTPETDAGDGGGDAEPTEFLPTDYEPGSTEADARLTLFLQDDGTGGGTESEASSESDANPESEGATAGTDDGDDEIPEAVAEAQLEVESLFAERFDDGFVFGEGITDAASSSAVGDSFAIITPVALVLVLSILAITYRDIVDVCLGLVGIAVVMTWLAGILGWLEIPTSQLLIAVPFLLIGLSIDYALHVVMRYREARAGTLEAQVGDGMGANSSTAIATDPTGGDTTGDAGTDATHSDAVRGVRTGMALGLGGVALALAAATFSTGIGFLSNVVSPLSAIRDFAILSAGGIFATFVAFGVFVPALKVEVDGVLEERFGRNRAKPAFGVTPGPVNRLLSGGVVLARRVPLAVVAVALLLAVGGAYGATGIDTEFNEADFLPEDAPEWAQSLPGPLAPDTYTISDDAEYLGETFQDRDSQAEILIRGDVTDPTLLAAIEDARENGSTTASNAGGGPSAANSTIDDRPDGTAAVDGPLTVLENIAADNETVADGFENRDTTGDGVPDTDLEGLYDLAADADPDATATVLERTDDGAYESALLTVSVRGDAASQAVADDVRAFASEVENGTGDSTDAAAGGDGGELEPATDDETPVTAIATGGPVTTAVVQDALLETLVQAFAVTLAVILAFLSVLYWVRHRALSLGAVTLAPVVVALAWLLGTMAVLDVPFNSETAVITSLAIGLGVDYSIHLGERFVVERERAATDGSYGRGEQVVDALETTITGTGGALLGSAATTAAGFGVLALALAPPLQRFGLVTGLSIVFAFVACLTVLPSLLVLRERVLARLEG